MKRYTVELRGVTPYLMSRFDMAALEGTTKKKSGSPNTKEHLLEEYESRAYKLPNGKYYVPSTHICGCLINAGKDIQIVGKRRSNYSKPFAASVDVEDEAIILDNQKPEMFTISGVNANTKGRVLIARPRFNKWNIKFNISCTDDQISGDAIQEGLERGGMHVGIGSWRPEKRGKFGKFTVTKFKEVR